MRCNGTSNVNTLGKVEKKITFYTIHEWRKTHKNDLNEPMEFKEKKILYLTLKKKWFDMILSGEKKEEYREIKEHWALILMIMDSVLVIDRAGNNYKKLKPAYWYSVGLCGSRVGAVKYLLQTCASFKEYSAIKFTNGYNKNSPSFIIELIEIKIGLAKPEWSDNWQGDVFVLKLGEII
jgi:hypothetical protein